MATPSGAQEEAMLLALAGAVVQHPRATLKELAEAIGISKATLYRFSSTREQLTTRLVRYCQQLYLRIVIDCDLETTPILQAFSQLIERMLEKPNFYTFLALHWNLGLQTGEDVYAQWAEQDHRMDVFFLRGQREGVFRSDIPALALADSFPFFMASLAECARRGRLAPVDLKSSIEKLFLDGARAA